MTTVITHTDFDQLIYDTEQQIRAHDPASIEAVHEVMEYAMSMGDAVYFARARYILALHSCMIAHDHDTAITYCHELLAERQDNGMAAEAPQIYLLLGNAYYWKGEFIQAQRAYLNTISLLKSIPSPNAAQKKELASVYNNLAVLILNSDISDVNKDAENYINRSIGIFEELNLPANLAASYSASSIIHFRRKDYPKALEAIQKALAISKQKKDLKNTALFRANLGEIYTFMEQYDKAHACLTDALYYYDQHLLSFEAVPARITYGHLLCRMGQLQEGIDELQEAEDVLQRYDSKNQLLRVYDYLALYLAEKGDFRSALEYQRKHTEATASLARSDKKMTMARYQPPQEIVHTKEEAVVLKEKNEEMSKYIGQLETSNNSLQQFAHMTSHDLREPLRMISAYVTLLRRSLNEAMNEEQVQFMEFILGGTRRMQNLINDLLRLGKVGTDPVIEKIDVSDIVEEVKLNLEVLLKEKNAQIDCSSRHTLLADRAMMMQLLQNLIGNGIKYNESAHPTVRIESSIVGNALELRVIDNGIGIPEHLRKKAFELFQRVHTDKQYTGTGIGLAICKKIAEAIGGWINVDDNPRGGSIFSVWFPISAVDMS